MDKFELIHWSKMDKFELIDWSKLDKFELIHWSKMVKFELIDWCVGDYRVIPSNRCYYKGYLQQFIGKFVLFALSNQIK